jgi:drug/metabolite transporter (DMT)-like permease
MRTVPSGRAPSLAFAALTFSVVAWGLAPVFTRFLLESLDPPGILVVRIYLSAAVALAVLFARGLPRLTRGEVARLLVASCIGNGGYQILSTYGMVGTPASWTGMLYGLEPIFVALLAAGLARERLSRPLILALAVGLAGSAIIVLAAGAASSTDVVPLDVAMVTISTLGWGIYTVVIKPLAQRHGVLDASLMSLVAVALPALPLYRPGLVHEVVGLAPLALAALVFLVVISNFVATIAWNFGVARMPSAVAGLFLYAQPLVAGLGGALLLGETLGPAYFAGGALILAGMWLAQRDVAN